MEEEYRRIECGITTPYALDGQKHFSTFRRKGLRRES